MYTEKRELNYSQSQHVRDMVKNIDLLETVLKNHVNSTSLVDGSGMSSSRLSSDTNTISLSGTPYVSETPFIPADDMVTLCNYYQLINLLILYMKIHPDSLNNSQGRFYLDDKVPW